MSVSLSYMKACNLCWVSGLVLGRFESFGERVDGLMHQCILEEGFGDYRALRM